MRVESSPAGDKLKTQKEMKMKSLKVVLLVALGLTYGEVCAAAFESVLENTIVGDVRVTADEAGG